MVIYEPQVEASYGYIYKLTFRNGKSYIGATRQPEKRFEQHRYEALHSNKPLCKAWREFGDPSFEILLIADYWDLHGYEARAISVFMTYGEYGYNRTNPKFKRPDMSNALAKRICDAVHARNVLTEKIMTRPRFEVVPKRRKRSKRSK